MSVSVSVSVSVGVGVGVGVSTCSAAHSCPGSGEGRGRAGSLPVLPLAMHQPGSWDSSTPQTIAGPLHTLWPGGSQCPAHKSALFTVIMKSEGKKTQ